MKVGPKPLKFQDMLARSYFNIAAMYREPEDAQRSLDASAKAVEYWSKLVDIAPSVTSYRVDLGGAYFSKAWTEVRLGRGSDALASTGQGPGHLRSFDPSMNPRISITRSRWATS